jgi:PAS domain S-box-containing protein
MAPDGGSSDRTRARELPAPGGGTGMKRHLAFVRKLAARARERVRSFAAMRDRLGVRLLSRVLLFSVCVTLILTLLQLFIEYRNEVSLLERRLEQIGNSYPDSIADRLWALDENQLRLQLSGILRRLDVRFVEIRELGRSGEPFVMSFGEKSTSSATITREYPLRYNVQGQDMVIGTLYVQATLDNIYGRLFNTGLTILIRQAAEIFLVSLFIVYIFHSLVTRHLFAIATFVDSYRINDPPLPLRLRRSPGRHEDELQRVVTAFNALSDDLQSAYRSLHDTNDQLTRDVAARREAETVLREREARIRRLIEANIIGIFIWDFEGRILEANDAFLDIVGYDREDLVAGRVRWMELTPADWLERDATVIQGHRITGHLQPYEKEYFRKDGARVPVLIGAATFEEGGDQGVAFVLDLTERKQAEKALRESEEQWKAVFEHNPTMYFMVDTSGIIVSVNPLGAEQLGFTVEDLVGQPVRQLFHVEDRAAVERNAAICFERPGQTMTWEARKIRNSGEVVWVREMARVMLIKDRPVALIVCEDITERKRVSEALREVQMELAHANRVATIGQLAASIAHEVNQPIAAAVTNAHAALRWLSARAPDIDEAKLALGRIVENGNRAAEVIGGIRALIRKAPQRKDGVAINDAILEVVALTHGETLKNGVSVRTELAESLPLVKGDRVGLQQVMLNLIVNAVEAMGGVPEGTRDLLVSSEKADSDGVLVAVRDSGPGLTPATLERLFDAFHTTKPNGLGLGLSICRSIIEAHGGRLWASPNAPRGAVFQFTLPDRPDAAT